jgi:hypothetical protein
MRENIVSWSHSKLGDFERCRFACKLKHLDRIPEPERPLPPGKSEHANDRGSRVHDSCEMYVSGQSDDLAPEAALHFGPELDLMRVLHEQGHVSLEGEWGMDKDWEVADWKSAWLRLKLDAAVFLDDEAVVIDYKTGRKFGNEVKHAEQLQLYALVTALRYPHIKRITAELWYLDQNETTRMTLTRDQALRFRLGFHKRGTALTTCDDWKPNPSRFVCKWCQYGPWNGGQCEVGVR